MSAWECRGVWQQCQQERRAINDRLAAAAGVCGAVLGASDTVCRFSVCRLFHGRLLVNPGQLQVPVLSLQQLI